MPRSELSHHQKEGQSDLTGKDATVVAAPDVPNDSAEGKTQRFLSWGDTGAPPPIGRHEREGTTTAPPPRVAASPISCKLAIEMFPDYLAQDLEDDRLHEFRQHLRECPHCHEKLLALELYIQLTARDTNSDESQAPAPQRPVAVDM